MTRSTSSSSQTRPRSRTHTSHGAHTNRSLSALPHTTKPCRRSSVPGCLEPPHYFVHHWTTAPSSTCCAGFVALYRSTPLLTHIHMPTQDVASPYRPRSIVRRRRYSPAHRSDSTHPEVEPRVYGVRRHHTLLSHMHLLGKPLPTPTARHPLAEAHTHLTEAALREAAPPTRATSQTRGSSMGASSAFRFQASSRADAFSARSMGYPSQKQDEKKR
jgi:hypothetical protein